MTFEEYVKARAAALTRYGYVLSGNGHDAADLVQEALVRLRQAWPRMRHRDGLDQYVRTTMARLYLHAAKRAQRERPTGAVPETGYTDGGIERVHDGEAAAGLWAALATVPPRQRAVLVLRHYEQLTDDEIADVLGISRGTVRSQAARGLDKLRALHIEPAGRKP